jgi:hypothetical protein
MHKTKIGMNMIVSQSVHHDLEKAKISNHIKEVITQSRVVHNSVDLYVLSPMPVVGEPVRGKNNMGQDMAQTINNL